MLFNSINFLIFFIVVTSLYFFAQQKYRWAILLSASVIFYMSFIPVYILVLALTIVVDYTAAILIEKSEGARRKFYFIISIISTSFILFIFKYFNFFNQNMYYLATFLHWNYSIKALSLVLPIGLSFHTFQSLSYVIEVYRRNQKAERHFGIYALYVMFYPQLVAGPIERPQNLLHQFYKYHHFDYERATRGLKLMLFGFFMKLAIADRLAIVVNTVYDNPANYAGFPLLLATIFFSFQIFCDFAGYSSIAIGAALVMGFKLMNNFELPYFSKSVAEFWRRWHISLSTWFRDYIYLPLGGSRVSKARMYFNLLVVFLISGLWHGANWTFVVWGAFHGSCIILSSMTAGIRKWFVHLIRLDKFQRTYNLIRIVITFSLVTLAWVFFRAESLPDAIYIITHLFTRLNLVLMGAYLGEISLQGLAIGIALIIFLLAINIFQYYAQVMDYLSKKPLVIRWACYITFILAILVFGVFNNTQFIYFQF